MKLGFLFTEAESVNLEFYADVLFESLKPDGRLYADIIRYIVFCIHPTNEILNSSKCKRWKFILHILTKLKTIEDVSHCLKALFFDWYTYRGNAIMFVEPGILLLFN